MKTVMKEFRKRLLDNDPTVLYYTLLVLDSVMKNCSTDVHSEVLSKEFMNIVKEIIVSSKVRTYVLMQKNVNGCCVVCRQKLLNMCTGGVPQAVCSCASCVSVWYDSMY